MYIGLIKSTLRTGKLIDDPRAFKLKNVYLAKISLRAVNVNVIEYQPLSHKLAFTVLFKDLYSFQKPFHRHGEMLYSHVILQPHSFTAGWQRDQV